MTRATPSILGDAIEVVGVEIDAIQLDAAVDELLSPNPPKKVHLCNAYTLSLATRDHELRNVLRSGDLNLPDGKPLIWIARSLGLRTMHDRVYGPDLMAMTLQRGQAIGTRHYLYGSTPEVLDALCIKIQNQWPRALIVGRESPPFRMATEPEFDETMENVRKARADIVWVGMGTPKQDKLVDEMARKGNETFVAIGAAFDFLAGTKRQAPLVMRQHGLEWLFRLVTEPRRLWRRYLVGNTIFICSLFRFRPKLVARNSRADSQHQNNHQG